MVYILNLFVCYLFFTKSHYIAQTGLGRLSATVTVTGRFYHAEIFPSLVLSYGMAFLPAPGTVNCLWKVLRKERTCRANSMPSALLFNIRQSFWVSGSCTSTVKQNLIIDIYPPPPPHTHSRPAQEEV